MKKIQLFCFCLTIIFLFGSASPQESVVKPDVPITKEKNRRLLVGKWLGEIKSENGKVTKWLVERLIDGTYQIIFRTYDNETEYKDQIEVGFWGTSGSIYFSIMKGWIEEGEFVPANPEDPYFYDAYKIIQLNSDTFNYEHFDHKTRYTVKKVADSFTFKK